MSKLTNDEFIKKAITKHGNKYDYSKVNYVNSKTKVCIICPEHGEFWQLPSAHVYGNGCNKCGIKVAAKKCRKTTDSFIKKAKEIHGDKYDYSKVTYLDAKTKVCIICPEHGEFWQTPNDHLSGKGCKKCAKNSIGKKLKSTFVDFVKKAKKVHGDKYDYSKVDYNNALSKVCIICPEHGEFWQTPNSHLSGNGCPICRESKLEKKVRDELIANKIDFIQKANKKIIPWIGEQHLDFYIESKKIAIECQGIQHYKPVTFGSKNKSGDEILKYIKENDLTKKQKCDENGIKLLYYSNEVCAGNVIRDITKIINIIKNG